jgi:hypothetical protein
VNQGASILRKSQAWVKVFSCLGIRFLWLLMHRECQGCLFESRSQVLAVAMNIQAKNDKQPIAYKPPLGFVPESGNG